MLQSEKQFLALEVIEVLTESFIIFWKINLYFV